MAKLFTDGDGYLLETSNGNYEIRNSGFYHTTRTTEGLTEAYPDITVQAVSTNGKASVIESNMVTTETAQAIDSLIQHLIETAE